MASLTISSYFDNGAGLPVSLETMNRNLKVTKRVRPSFWLEPEPFTLDPSEKPLIFSSEEIYGQFPWFTGNFRMLHSVELYPKSNLAIARASIRQAHCAGHLEEHHLTPGNFLDEPVAHLLGLHVFTRLTPEERKLIASLRALESLAMMRDGVPTAETFVICLRGYGTRMIEMLPAQVGVAQIYHNGNHVQTLIVAGIAVGGNEKAVKLQGGNK